MAELVVWYNTEGSLLIKKWTFNPLWNIANVMSFTVGGRALFFSVCQEENNLRLHQSCPFPTTRNLNLQTDFIGLNKFWQVSRKICLAVQSLQLDFWVFYIYLFFFLRRFGAYQRNRMIYASRFWTVHLFKITLIEVNFLKIKFPPKSQRVPISHVQIL